MVVGEIVNERELIIIGGGPGGYNAAIRAAQLGLEVTLIEKGELGGVCLNEGCIPSKVFTHAAGKLAETKHMNDLGISFSEPVLDIEKLQQWKSKVISGLTNGVEGLLKKNEVEVIQGNASFISEDRIGVESGDAFELYRFEKAIIAVGSSLQAPEGVTVNHKQIVDAASVYRLQTIPEHLVVYGSDYISLEVAMSYHAFGSKVSLILDGGKSEFSFDTSINRELSRQLKKAKIKLYKISELKSVDAVENGVKVRINTKKGEEDIEASTFFSASRNTPNTRELGLDRAGVEVSEGGLIQVNNEGQTNKSSIYAVGDVTDGVMLAVKAVKQGKVAAESCAGKSTEFDLNYMPTVVHTIPPIAFVGLTEEEAKEQGYDTNVGQFPFGGNGYAGIIDQKDGFVKVISDKETDLLLGFHAVGAGAVELVSQGTQALEMVARDEDVTFPFYPHPSLNEGWLEAVEALKDQAIHTAPIKRQTAKTTQFF